MKAKFTRILSELDDEVFRIQHYCQPQFSTNFHFHPECQLNYVIKSNGQRVIGDNISTFENDEITFLGPNLPHVWYTDSNWGNGGDMAISMTLFIQVERLLLILKPFIETHPLEQFFSQAEKGLLFHGENQKMLKSLLIELHTANGLRRVILFLELLDQLITAKQYDFLSSSGYYNTYSSLDNNRIDRIFRYVVENFQREIRLEEVADVANMTKQAFCRYFKNRTQKSFIQFVNEVRVSRACQKMSNADDLISNIAYECGFSSLSNFNKIFKTIKGITPRQYRNEVIQSGVPALSKLATQNLSDGTNHHFFSDN